MLNDGINDVILYFTLSLYCKPIFHNVPKIEPIKRNWLSSATPRYHHSQWINGLE